MTAKAIMFQGTGSDVGKSLVVAGLCRAFVRRGLKVKPFKPQNMSNNAAVTADGGEIGRAQALQAKACGVALHTDMNPVLLKPQSEIGSQIIVQGKMWGTAKARDYQGLKPQLLSYVLESFERLKQDCDLVMIEGAGSAAEVNLRKGDIANMGFACATNTPVVLIGDIDRGGVIAQLVGTYELLPDEERALLAGYIINKFRGDVSLFDDGLTLITERTDMKSVGVATYFKDAHKLPPEDAVALPSLNKGNSQSAIKIVVPVLPRISNFDDLDPLRAEPDVEVVMVPSGDPLPADVDLVLLPGSKATLADLQAFKDEGWDIDLKAHVRRGGLVFGICGGYQMLGTSVADPEGIEGPASQATGLGLLNVETIMTGNKQLTEVTGKDLSSETEVQGYHMHIGQTKGDDRSRPIFLFGNESEGATSADGLVSGAYIHGLFANDEFRHTFLSNIKSRTVSDVAYDKQVEETLDALADHLETCLDLDHLLENAR